MPEHYRSPLIRTHLGIVVFVFSLKSSTNVKGCEKSSITKGSVITERREETSSDTYSNYRSPSNT